MPTWFWIQVSLDPSQKNYVITSSQAPLVSVDISYCEFKPQSCPIEKRLLVFPIRTCTVQQSFAVNQTAEHLAFFFRFKLSLRFFPHLADICSVIYGLIFN